ncbi:MAG: twin-arginine translocase TatA/TatE family subunit [Caulobacterales bacterium]
MGSLSPIHWLIIAAVLLVVFARPGKLSGFMGDAAKGIRAFRDGLKNDEEKAAAAAPPATPAQPLPRAEVEKDPIVR